MSDSMISAENTGVIVVDVQADFTELKSGALAVPGTDIDYIDDVQKATRRFQEQGLRIYFTLDWHPVDHISFYTNNPGTEPLQEVEIEEGRTQVMWPPHCVQNTPGADILIDIEGPAERIQTGANPKFDSYSGFVDDGGNPTGLDRLLRRDGIKELVIYGLATDYCVKHTVLDAAALGYQVELLLNLCRGISPETTASALKEMEARGVNIIRN
ncbi:MAG: isochorismatase family protein [Desulfobacterales bacterium]